MEPNKDYFIQLTNRLYKITLLFPKKEPLRYKIREVADNILANFLRITNEYEYTNTRNKNAENCSWQILEDLEILDSFFEVAKNQNWVQQNEISALQQEYKQLSQGMKELSDAQPKLEFTKQIFQEEKKPQPIQKTSPSINERQGKILEVLKEKDRIQVWEVQKVFPGVSKRTLRRDFRFLLQQGFIERGGERNTTFYQIKS